MDELMAWVAEVSAEENEVFVWDGYYDEYTGQHTGYMVPKYKYVFDNLGLEDAFGLKWERLRTEHVSDNADEDGDIVSRTTHIWATLPRWGAFRDYDQTSLTVKGLEKNMRAIYSATTIQDQFNKPSTLFDKLAMNEIGEAGARMVVDINRQTYQ